MRAPMTPDARESFRRLPGTYDELPSHLRVTSVVAQV
jgi:hypothetical protein